MPRGNIPSDRKGVKNILSQVIGCLNLLLFCAHAWAYELQVHQDRITIHADQVRLQAVMKDLARQTGIVVHIDPDLNPSEGPITDAIGHGTQMALVASGVVAPFGNKKSTHHDNQIVSIRTFDKK